MRCVAVIPARGGSRGIPRKNLRRLGGETLLARAIRKCRQASEISQTFVTTEDDDIAAEAAQHGATVIWRPAELSRDESKSDETLLHACKHIEADILAFVQCTAPFMSVEELDGTIRTLVSTEADLAVAVAPSEAMRVQLRRFGRRKIRARGDGWDMNDPLTLRQHREPCYEICGSIWAFWVDRFLVRRRVYSKDCAIYKAQRRFEIDDPLDLQWAVGIDLTYQ